jgi:hypothetical protein
VVVTAAAVAAASGYNYDNVVDWTGDINMLAKAFIYIPVIESYLPAGGKMVGRENFGYWVDEGLHRHSFVLVR